MEGLSSNGASMGQCFEETRREWLQQKIRVMGAIKGRGVGGVLYLNGVESGGQGEERVGATHVKEGGEMVVIISKYF